MKERSEVDTVVYDIKPLTDRTVVSRTCWLHMPLSKRIWFYANLITNGDYEVHPFDREQIKKIVPALEQGKCIVFVGQPGSGKTTLTQIIAKVTAPLGAKDRFKFVKAIHIVEEFMKYGFDSLKKYCDGRWIIDDIGIEQDAMIGGNFKQTYNVFEQVIYEMCEAHMKGRCQFILSTNLSFKNSNSTAQDSPFILKYGTRVETRIQQVCEVIKINGTNYRATKNYIPVFPEVIHRTKETFVGIPAPENVLQLLEKLAAKKKVHTQEDFQSVKTPKTIISGLFEEYWGAQGKPVNDAQERYIEMEDGTKLTRAEFINQMEEQYNASKEK